MVLVTNPTADPLALFLVQFTIVMVFTRGIGRLIRYIKQPLVIGEVFGGVLLGPSVMGQIPGWSNSIFPTSSTASFQLVANIGLVLFMFYMGLEVDPALMRRQWRIGAPIALSAIAFPFAIGAASAVWLVNVNDLPGASYVAFVLFFGAAMSFTAFPVLASILSSTKILNSPLGILALSCSSIDDVTAWCVLAVASSFAGSSDPVNGIYTTLIAAAYVLFMLFVVRKALKYVHVRFNESREELSRTFVIGIFIMLAMSAMFAECIGIHAFFGSFVAGIVVPKSGKFVRELAPKMELVIVDFFLPLYFVNSGLSTDINSLSGSDWGIVVFIIVLASCGKFIPTVLMTRLMTKKDWRFCTSMGILMNTRGLVELISLNVGLNLGILSLRMFTMMVIMALVTTFLTSPILYFTHLRHLGTGDLDVRTRALPDATSGTDARGDIPAQVTVSGGTDIEQPKPEPEVANDDDIMMQAAAHATVFAGDATYGDGGLRSQIVRHMSRVGLEATEERTVSEDVEDLVAHPQPQQPEQPEQQQQQQQPQQQQDV